VQPRPDRTRSSHAVGCIRPLQIGGRSSRSLIWRAFHDFEAGSSLRPWGQRKSCYVAAGGTFALAIAGEIIWQQAVAARHKKFYFGAALRPVRPANDWRHLRGGRSGHPPLHRRAYCHDARSAGPTAATRAHTAGACRVAASAPGTRRTVAPVGRRFARGPGKTHRRRLEAARGHPNRHCRDGPGGTNRLTHPAGPAATRYTVAADKG
jgi:hypothetical protein